MDFMNSYAMVHVGLFQGAGNVKVPVDDQITLALNMNKTVISLLLRFRADVNISWLVDSGGRAPEIDGTLLHLEQKLELFLSFRDDTDYHVSVSRFKDCTDTSI